jgi:hypothetical protein
VPWVPCAGTNSLREAISNENSQPAITNWYVRFFKSRVYDLNHSPQRAKLILANASNVTLDGSDCQSLWGYLADFEICNEDTSANTCEFHNNAPGTTCEQICAEHA